MEDHGGDDVVEDHGVADEHFQGGEQGHHYQLDPVTVGDGVGRLGEHDHVDGRAGCQQQGEDSDDTLPAGFPVKQDEQVYKCSSGCQQC